MTIIQSAFLVSLFVAAAFAAYGIIMLFSPTAVQKRLASLAGGAPPPEAPAEEQPSAVMRFLGRLGKPTLAQTGKLTPTRARFFRAGIRSPAAPAAFYGLKTVLGVAFPLVGFLALASTRLAAMPLQLVLLLAILAAIGYFLPDAILARVTERRQTELFYAFPDALDLMRVCVEAGLSLDAAIQRVGVDIRIESPELADELHLVSLELRAGASRSDALRNLAMRVDLEDVDGLVSMLVQSDRFGTSVAEALKVHSAALRRRRQLIAEERAAKLPVKLLFPLVFCIFPALLTVILTPAILSIARTLLPVLSSGR